jgi:hypothetical protein
VSWTPIAPEGGYPQQIASAGNACGWPVGTPVYGGAALGWQEQRFDLSAVSGPIRLRWMFSTDLAGAAQGWFVDSIAIAPAQVSGSCTAMPNAASLTLAVPTPSPAIIGRSLSLPFTLQATPSGTPTGSVTLELDSGESCVALLPESACELVPMQAGLRTLTARYSGDGDFPAAEATLPLQIDRAPLGLQLEITSLVPTPPGPVHLRIGVSEAAELGAASGEVIIESDLDSATCSLVLPQTTCALTLTSTGTHQLSARYAGDARYAPDSVSLPHLVYSSTELFGDGFE